MKKHYRHENDCLNCGTELKGKYCYNCGQENLQIKESFGHMMSHAISDYFHFDQKFFHTLKPLFFSPGKLTNEYLIGHRAQYLHPVKMYIFISLVYFVLLFQSGFEPVKVTTHPDKHKSRREIDSTNRALDSIAKDPNIPSFAKAAILQAKIDTNKTTVDTTFIGPKTNDTSYAQYLTSESKLPPAKRDGWFMRLYNKKAFAYRAEYGSMAKKVITEEFEHNIPKMMFLMLPLCALILMIAFWSNKKYYVEHLIYSFHLHCFMFLFLAIIMLIELIFPASNVLNGILDWIATIGIIWYIYRSLRTFYNRSRWRTVSKMIGASIMYLFIFTFCLVLVFVITALMA